MNDKPLHENFQVWLKGDQDAIAFCLMVFRIGNVWDDLIDKDTPVSNEDIYEAFWSSLIEMPQNPFYARFFSQLHPIMKMGIINWKSANTLESSNTPEHKLMAYTLRLVITDVVTMCALIIGGREWAEHVHLQMQLAYPESFSEYQKTLPVGGTL